MLSDRRFMHGGLLCLNGRNKIYLKTGFGNPVFKYMQKTEVWTYEDSKI